MVAIKKTSIIRQRNVINANVEIKKLDNIEWSMLLPRYVIKHDGKDFYAVRSDKFDDWENYLKTSRRDGYTPEWAIKIEDGSDFSFADPRIGFLEALEHGDHDS